MSLHIYLPQDRLRALARGETLPDRTGGSALFADLSGFTALTEATAPQIGIYDVDALHAYFGANSPVGPTAADRIIRIN